MSKSLLVTLTLTALASASCQGGVVGQTLVGPGAVANTGDAATSDEPGGRTDTLPSGGQLDAGTKPAPVEQRADGGSMASPTPQEPAPDRTDGCPADAPLPLNRVRIYPSSGGGATLLGVRFQGSNDGPTGAFEDLTVVEQAVPDGSFTELTFENEVLYRYLRFFDPESRPTAIAELEFYHGQTRLSGRSFGTVSEGANDHPFDNALDGDVATYFAGTTSGGRYAGLDIGGAYVAAAPTFSPAAGVLSAPADVTLASTTPGASIRYTLDGNTPSAQTGQTYQSPVRVGTSRVNLRAVASAKCYFDSEPSSALYTSGATPVSKGQKSYHIGNSLTDTIDGYLEPIADSTGVDHQYARMTVPGSPLGYIWKFRNVVPDGKTQPLKEAANQDPAGAGDIDNFVKSFAPIDHITVQPFADPALKTEGGAAAELFNTALQANPNAQFWIYAQWANQFAVDSGSGSYLQDSLAAYDPATDSQKPLDPSSTWEDVTRAQLRYHEAFRDYVDARVEGKKLLVIPAGLALIELKQRIERGLVPGMTSFFPAIFQDYLHLNPPGRYLVSLVFYACFYKQTPEGRVTMKPDALTQEQAKVFQQIAWQVASTYPLSGIQ